jgi:hypothetical protein
MSWKIITTHPAYEVSDAGEVRNIGTGRVRKPHTANGYHQVALCNNGIKTTLLVHRLVGLYHLENPENKPQIDHIDRNRTNNNVSNLRWATRSENCQNKDYYYYTKTDGNHYITITINQTFQVQFHKSGSNVYKNFKTLEEAIAFRDQYITDNPR